MTCHLINKSVIKHCYYYKNGRTDRDAIWAGAHSCGTKKLCDRWGPDSPQIPHEKHKGKMLGGFARDQIRISAAVMRSLSNYFGRLNCSLVGVVMLANYVFVFLFKSKLWMSLYSVRRLKFVVTLKNKPIIPRFTLSKPLMRVTICYHYSLPTICVASSELVYDFWEAENKAVIDRRLRPRCCHLKVTFNLFPHFLAPHFRYRFISNMTDFLLWKR